MIRNTPKKIVKRPKGDAERKQKEVAEKMKKKIIKKPKGDVVIMPFLESEKAVAEKTKASILKHNPDVQVIMVDGKAPSDLPSSKKLTWVFFNKVVQAYRDRGFQRGFYYVESGVKIKKPFKDWIKEHAPDKPKDRPYWMGFTKVLSDYRVGSKVLFFPPAVVDDIEKRYKEGKLKLQHTDRMIQGLNPVLGKEKKVGKTTLPGDDLFALFPKKSAFGTKHHPSLYEE